MKKMIISDLLIARRSLPVQILLSIGVGVLCAMMTGELVVSLSIGFAVFSFGHCIGVSLWDEQNSWHSMRLAMPFSRKEIVLGRYCTALVFMLIGLMCGLTALAVAALGMRLFMPETFETSMMELACEQFDGVQASRATALLFAQNIGVVVMLIAIVLLVYCSVQYLLGFRFGMEKAGKIIPVALAVFMAFLVALSDVTDIGNVLVLFLEGHPTMLIVPLAFLAALVLYAVSCFISVRVYEKRSF